MVVSEEITEQERERENVADEAGVTSIRNPTCALPSWNRMELYVLYVWKMMGKLR